MSINGKDYAGSYPHLLLLKNQKKDCDISLEMNHDLSLDEEIPKLLTIKGYKWKDDVWTNSFSIKTPYQTSSTWCPIDLEFMLLPNYTWGYRFRDTGWYLDSNNPIISLAEHEMIYKILKYLTDKYKLKIDTCVKENKKFMEDESNE